MYNKVNFEAVAARIMMFSFLFQYWEKFILFIRMTLVWTGKSAWIERNHPPCLKTFMYYIALSIATVLTKLLQIFSPESFPSQINESTERKHPWFFFFPLLLAYANKQLSWKWLQVIQKKNTKKPQRIPSHFLTLFLTGAHTHTHPAQAKWCSW